MSSEQHPKEAEGCEDPGGSSKPTTIILPLPIKKEMFNSNKAESISEFNVEAITGKRYANGKVQMQVKWEGFPPERSTWEPLANLANCIGLVAEFESKLFDVMEKAKNIKSKKKKKDTAIIVSPSPEPGKRQLATDEETGPMSNADQPFTSDFITGNQKENIPIKLLPALNFNISDEDPPSFSFGNEENTTSADQELSARALSPSAFLESTISGSGFSSQPLGVLSTSNDNIKVNPLNFQIGQANKNIPKVGSPLNPQKKPRAKGVSKKKQVNSKSETPENAVKKAAKDIHSMQIGDKRPEVHPQLQGSKKSKKTVKERKGIEKPESKDDDSEVPWMTPCQAVFGLARGLELDKVQHSFKVGDRHFLFVSWKGVDAMDTVPMEELKEAYPAQVLQYFENLERRY